MSSQRITKNYREITRSLLQTISALKKHIETINKGQEEMNNTSSQLKNTVEGSESGLMKQRIESVSWRKKEKKPPQKSKKMKKD